MKHWWGKYNIRSLDGLPAFSVGMGLGVKFERLLKGMRGGFTPNRVINSNEIRPSSSDRNAPKMISSSPNLIFETLSLSQILQGYGSRLGDLPSLVSALIPLFIAFVLGVLLGQMYDKHTFPLSLGAA
jgi:hypothetical protein